MKTKMATLMILGMAHTKQTTRAQAKESLDKAKGKMATPAQCLQLRKITAANKKSKAARDKGMPPPPGPTKQRYRPGTVALRQIRKYQKSMELLLHQLPFQHLVHKIASQYHQNFCFQYSVFGALQEACEAYMVSLFEDAQVCALHARRKMVMKPDTLLVWCIRGETQNVTPVELPKSILLLEKMHI